MTASVCGNKQCSGDSIVPPSGGPRPHPCSLSPVNPHLDDHQGNVYRAHRGTVLDIPGLADTSLLPHPASLKTLPQPTSSTRWMLQVGHAGGLCRGAQRERGAVAAGAPGRLPATLSADRYHVILPLRSPICLTVPICQVLPQTVSSLGQRLTLCLHFYRHSMNLAEDYRSCRRPQH